MEKEGLLKYGTLSAVSGNQRGKYKAFYWFRLEFNEETKAKLKHKYKGYEGIHFMPYAVDEELWNKIKEKKHFDGKYDFPNIDTDSGNLHPEWGEKDLAEWLINPVIKQAVLVRKITVEKSGKETIRWGCKKSDAKIIMNDFTELGDIVDCNCFFTKPDEVTFREWVDELFAQLLEEK